MIWEVQASGTRRDFVLCTDRKNRMMNFVRTMGSQARYTRSLPFYLLFFIVWPPLFQWTKSCFKWKGETVTRHSIMGELSSCKKKTLRVDFGAINSDNVEQVKFLAVCRSIIREESLLLFDSLFFFQFPPSSAKLTRPSFPFNTRKAFIRMCSSGTMSI